MFQAAITRSVTPDLDERKAAAVQADAAIGALQSLGKSAQAFCKDGAYYTEEGEQPTGGEIACKLDLIEGSYHENTFWAD